MDNYDKSMGFAKRVSTQFALNISALVMGLNGLDLKCLAKTDLKKNALKKNASII